MKLSVRDLLSKHAGIFEYPKKLSKNIESWVMNEYVKRVAGYLDNDAPQDLKYAVERQSGEKETSLDVVEAKFPIDISDWKYVGPKEKTLLEEYGGSLWEDLNVTILFLAGHIGFSGKADSYQNVVVIEIPEYAVLPKTLLEFQKYSREIKVTVRHEVTHVGQSLLYALKQYPKRMTGLPSKRVAPEEYTLQDDQGEYLRSGIEFYPYLKEDVERLRTLFRRYRTPQERREVFLWFIGAIPNQKGSGFFEALKKSRPQYLKAIKELYKQLEKHI